MFAIGEVDFASVGRPSGRCGPAFSVCHQLDAAAVRFHDEDLVGGIAISSESDPRAIRRPRGPTLEGRVIGEVARIRTVGISDEDLGVHFADHSAKRDPRSIG